MESIVSCTKVLQNSEGQERRGIGYEEHSLSISTTMEEYTFPTTLKLPFST